MVFVLVLKRKEGLIEVAPPWLLDPSQGHSGRSSVERLDGPSHPLSDNSQHEDEAESVSSVAGAVHPIGAAVEEPGHCQLHLS